MIKCVLATARVAANVVNDGLRGSTDWLISYLSHGGTVAENGSDVCCGTGRGLSSHGRRHRLEIGKDIYHILQLDPRYVIILTLQLGYL